ncbi:MAG: helix-turn-helix transcriptional regulator [Anaerolineaceae bacterium]|nr:helix-turn-helix transcriptional regulator [Anaerolineaceae bacterium]
MAAVLLHTKLFRPPIRPSLVPRPHLIEKLNQGLHHKLTLISAPAGFGKTTLVSEWLSAGERPSAWLSLDENDAEPIRFLTYLVAALQRVVPEIGKAVWKGLQSPQPPPVETLLTNLLNEIAAISDPIILVLDDYHRVEANAVDQALTFLLEHLPPPLHLVITTREDPQLPLPRLRARSLLTELRAADLRFTPGQAAVFLNQVMGLNLSAEDVASLETRTEGWIAGLQLAALALQGELSSSGREESSEFIKAFAGDNRYIVDYLAEEVLRHQPEHIRTFLLQTSILDRLSGPLCDAITEQADGSTLLETLERGNLFVISLDDKRHWYRYHHLFADVLHAYLMREQPDTALSLHRRASTWYDQNNSPPDAIRHALLAKDFERAAALVEMEWPALFSGHRPITWRGWVQALPAALVRTRPVLNMGCAWTLLDDGELEEADAYLRIAERALAAVADDPANQPEVPVAEMVIVNKAAYQTLPASIASARAYLAQAQGDSHSAIQNASRALRLFPEDEHYSRGLAALFLGLAYWAEGSLTAAGDAISNCLANMQMVPSGSFQIVATATAMLADLKAEQGHLHEAARIYAHSLQVAAEQGELALQETADQYIGLSNLHREWNNLEKAAQHLQKGQQDLGQHAILPGSVSRWHVAMARLKLAEGSLSDALDQLHMAERLYKRDPIPDVRPAAALKAQLWLAQGNIAQALDWAHGEGLTADDDLSYLREYHHMTLARILIAQYRQDREKAAMTQAVGLLERLLQAAEAGGRGRSLVEILVLQALAYQEQGEMATAVAAIQRALSLAEPEGYVRLFVDEGEPMRELLAACLTQGATPEYVTRLMQAIDPAPDPIAAPPDLNQMLIEPLSDRELEVLALIGNGLTNQAIADELVIALSTVKKHVNNIFGKLNVSSRTQAVNRAQELAIL